jgi:hypothetical protein
MIWRAPRDSEHQHIDENMVQAACMCCSLCWHLASGAMHLCAEPDPARCVLAQSLGSGSSGGGGGAVGNSGEGTLSCSSRSSTGGSDNRSIH